MLDEHRNMPNAEDRSCVPIGFILSLVILLTAVLLAACASAERNYWAGVSTQVGKSYENSARIK